MIRSFIKFILKRKKHIMFCFNSLADIHIMCWRCPVQASSFFLVFSQLTYAFILLFLTRWDFFRESVVGLRPIQFWIQCTTTTITYWAKCKCVKHLFYAETMKWSLLVFISISGSQSGFKHCQHLCFLPRPLSYSVNDNCTIYC